MVCIVAARAAMARMRFCRGKKGYNSNVTSFMVEGASPYHEHASTPRVASARAARSCILPVSLALSPASLARVPGFG